MSLAFSVHQNAVCQVDECFPYNFKILDVLHHLQCHFIFVFLKIFIFFFLLWTVYKDFAKLVTILFLFQVLIFLDHESCEIS